jgi:hypothetical protein
MDKPRPSITPLPASALFHFAFPLREYAAIKAATAFFAEKLRDPKEKEVAQRGGRRGGVGSCAPCRSGEAR